MHASPMICHVLASFVRFDDDVEGRKQYVKCTNEVSKYVRECRTILSSFSKAEYSFAYDSL